MHREASFTACCGVSPPGATVSSCPARSSSVGAYPPPTKPNENWAWEVDGKPAKGTYLDTATWYERQGITEYTAEVNHYGAIVPPASVNFVDGLTQSPPPHTLNTPFELMTTSSSTPAQG